MNQLMGLYAQPGPAEYYTTHYPNSTDYKILDIPGAAVPVTLWGECDAAAPSTPSYLTVTAMDAFGRIDILINNAGKTMYANIEDVRDPSIFEKLMRINYLGSVYCTYYALPYLKQTQGRILGISSLTGKTGVPTRSGYAASKHAMAGFFDSLRIEMAPHNVSVTMIYPGFVATAVREQAFGENGQSVGRSTVRESEIMPVETCAKIILQAAAQRKREVVMTWRGKIGIWLKLIAPGLVDRIARKAIRTGR